MRKEWFNRAKACANGNFCSRIFRFSPFWIVITENCVYKRLRLNEVVALAIKLLADADKKGVPGQFTSKLQKGNY